MSERPADDAAPLVRLVEDLLAQLEGTAVTECEFRSGMHRVLVRRSPSFVPPSPRPFTEDPDAVPDTWQAISAPLAGIFYAAELPQSPPFARVGDAVVPHQVVGLIESMKMFNSVESELEGTVRAILTQNGSLVERGQVLMYVEPQGDLP
jgi:biotin carboxyl carrier protein